MLLMIICQSELAWKRHLEAQCTCSDCGVEEETTYHVLVKCTFAWCFWQSIKELCGYKFLSLHLLLGHMTCLIILFVHRSSIVLSFAACGQSGPSEIKETMGRLPWTSHKHEDGPELFTFILWTFYFYIRGYRGKDEKYTPSYSGNRGSCSPTRKKGIQNLGSNCLEEYVTG